jgi:hypothetical protein
MSVNPLSSPLPNGADHRAGWFGARAFEQSEQYIGRDITLVGDECTVPQLQAAYARVHGSEASVAPVPSFMLRFLPTDYAAMFKVRTKACPPSLCS